MTDLKIDRLALDGDGIGRLSNGQAAFVPYVLPGELIKARLLLQKKDHSRWLPENINQSAPSRITPACPYHFRSGTRGAWCGGCDWQHMPTSTQMEAKRQLVVETLERLGGVKNPPVEATVPSPRDWRYRNKVQVPLGRRGNQLVAGFFAPGSHTIVEFNDCLVQPTPSVQIVHFVKKFANETHWRPYDEDKHVGWIRHLLVRTNEAGQALVTLVTSNSDFHNRSAFVAALRRQFPFVIGIHQNVQPARTNVILGRTWIRLWGSSHIDEMVLGLKISCSVGSFFQVNKQAADRLYEKALEELNIQPANTVLDLYCGAGALTLAAARKARYAIGVESAASSARDASENARQNNISNVTFIEGEAEKVLSKAKDKMADVDPDQLLVVLDPPRSGCDPSVLNALLKLNPLRIVYISCHPATLARDVKILSEKFRARSITPVDLFPQTSHIETVCCLERL